MQQIIYNCHEYDKINLISNSNIPHLEGIRAYTKHLKTFSFCSSRERSLKFLLPNNQLTQTAKQLKY